MNGLRSLRHRLWALLRDEATTLVVLTVLIGVFGGLMGWAFHSLSHLILLVVFGRETPNLVAGLSGVDWWLRLLVPAAGGLLAGLVRQAYLRRRGGFGEILEAVVAGSGVLRLRRAVPNAVSSLLTYGTGGSVGREGAIVQLSAAMGSWLGRKAKVERSRLKMLCGCGVAAGISAAYRTPIAGALFALEVIYRRFAFDELGPIVVASVAATFTAYTLVGRSPLYLVADYSADSFAPFVPCLLIGLLSGPLAMVFQRTLGLSDKAWRRLPGPLPIKTTLGGLLVGGLCVAMPEVAGNGYEPITRVLSAPPVLGALVFLMIGKIVATAVTVGSGGVGGVFTPTLLIGATFGGAVGTISVKYFPGLGDPHLYALVGMACLLAATTRAPIMAILMVFETTQQYELILPLMLGAIVASGSARLFGRESIYTAEIRRRGVALPEQQEADVLARLTARDIVRDDAPLIPHTLPLDTILSIFRDTRELYLYVGDGEGRFLGVIDLHDLKDFLGTTGYGTSVLAADLMQPVPPVEASTVLLDVERRLRVLEVGRIPVIDSVADGRFLGIVTRKDLLAAVERAILLSEKGPIPEQDAEGRRGRLKSVLATEEVVRAGRAERAALLGGSLVAVRRTDGDGTVQLFDGGADELRPGDVLFVVPDIEG